MEEALLLDLEGGAEDGNGSVSQREGEREREREEVVQESIRQPSI